MKRLHRKLKLGESITVRDVDVRIERVGRRHVTISVPAEEGASTRIVPAEGKVTLKGTREAR